MKDACIVAVVNTEKIKDLMRYDHVMDDLVAAVSDIHNEDRHRKLGEILVSYLTANGAIKLIEFRDAE